MDLAGRRLWNNPSLKNGKAWKSRSHPSYQQVAQRGANFEDWKSGGTILSHALWGPGISEILFWSRVVWYMIVLVLCVVFCHRIFPVSSGPILISEFQDHSGAPA